MVGRGRREEEGASMSWTIRSGTSCCTWTAESLSRISNVSVGAPPLFFVSLTCATAPDRALEGGGRGVVGLYGGGFVVGVEGRRVWVVGRAAVRMGGCRC